MIQELIDNISENRIQNFIRSKNSAYKEVTEDYSYKLTDDRFSDLKKLGYIDYADSDSLLVFSCKYNDDLSSRSSKKMQFEIAKNLLKEDFKDGAVFVFYDNAGRFRFSFIRKNYGNKVQKFTTWKRYTYFVDKTNQTNKTFINCIGNASFLSLEDIQEGFSLEPLSDEFFYRYKEIYGKFVGYITGKYYKKKNSKWEEVDYADHEPDFIQFKREFNSNNKQVRDYVKKLLGRLVFLKFIEKKGWLGKIEETKEIEPNFLENVFKNSSYKDDFLDKVLEEVIFESLNNPIGNTNKCEELKKYSFPYLNGGLFEKDELDNKSIRFPEEYFQEIFEFFNQYNFTIDENDPNDAEVSVDPEMLGHIFENLLEDNKDKGAFYTPKEIVHYMCQESLIEYLCTSLNFDTDNEKDLIIELVKTKVINKDLKGNLIEVEKALEKVKICDPAIGSGAFPMGLLQEIFSIKQSIYYNIHNTLDNFPAAEKKLNIIQNNIYGVDIEQGAVDIARLRFWLSLIVDETEAKPLPNLDYKIMCGNSLISRYPLDMPLKNVFDQYNKGRKPEDKLSLRRYKDLVNDYTDLHYNKDSFRAMIEEIKTTFKTSLSSKEINYRVKKAKIVNEYEEVGIFGTRKADHDKAGYKKAKLELEKYLKAEEDVKNNKIYENSFEWRFEFPDLLDEEGNFQGFNIVIGNPPYGASFSKTETKFFNNKYIYKDNETESYILFIEKSASLQSILGSVWFIIPSNISTNHNYSNIRKFILSNFSLHIIVDLGANIFKNAKVDSCIIAFKNKQINNNNFYSGKISEIDISKIELKISKQDYFLATPQNIFNFYISADTSNLIQKINSKTTLRLSDFINFSRGIEYGYNSNFVSSDKNNKKPLVAGRCFYRYTLKFENKYIDFDYNDTSNFKNNCIYETTKIFVRRIGKEIIAYLDDEKYYNVCDVYNLLPKSNDVDLYELLGLLNSKCINYYFKNFFKNAKVLFPKIPIKYLKQIPIILSNGNISKLAKKIQEDKKNDIDTFVLENEIDHLVYKLYDLTYDEVLVIDPLTPITREEYELEID